MLDIAYPFAIGESLPSEVTTDSDVFGGAIKMLFETAIGEIEGRPSYGTDLWSYVFEDNMPGRTSMILASVSGPVRRFIPQASVVSAAVRQVDTDVYVPIAYQISTRRGVLDIQVSRD